jgi:MFS family permease
MTSERLLRWVGEREDPARPGLARSLFALSLVNFFMADVQSGLGPFLGVYLINQPGWNAATIGLEMTLGAGIGLVMQTPMGALIDATRHKRTLLSGAALLFGLGAAVIALSPSVLAVTVGQLLTGLAGVLLGPTVTAIALGLVGPERFTSRSGRMAAFNHAGTLVGSVVVGTAGFLIGLRTGFWIASLSAFLVVAVTFLIRSSLIDDAVARGFDRSEDTTERAAPSAFRLLVRNRPLLILAVVTGVWQLANGGMLPITVLQLAAGDGRGGALDQTAFTVVAQIIMIPMALLVAARGDRWGRKPLYLVSFAVLPIRGLLFALFSANTGVLVATQALDGVGAGIQGAVFAVMVADLTRGTGRFNLAFGAATVVQSVGAICSTGLAGVVVVALGYTPTMLALTGVAALSLVLLVFGVPETAPGRRREPDQDAGTPPPTGSPVAPSSP